MAETVENEPQDCDLLVHNAHVVTVDSENRIHRPGAVAVVGGAIVAVGADEEVAPAFRAQRRIDARGAVVHPGFVEGHVHVSEHLDRGGWSPDTFTWSDIMGWGPGFLDALTDEDEEAGSYLGCLELVRNGATFFLEAGTVLEPDTAARAAQAVGIRASLADPFLWDLGGISRDQRPTNRIPHDTERALSVLGTELERNKDPHALVRGHIAVYGIGACSDELTHAAKACADENGVVFAQHQSFDELDTGVSDELHGRHPLVHYAETGLLDENCNFYHMNFLRDDEVAPVIESGMSITWCPSACMFFNVGATFRGRHVELYHEGVNVALGSDACNCGSAFDLGIQAFLAVLTAREKTRERTLNAYDALRMATINGARAVGLEDTIGSLEVGKRADLVVRREDLPEAQPVLDAEIAALDHRRAHGPIQNVVYATQSKSVDTVLVDGQVVVEGGHSTRVDEERVYREVTASARRVYQRMGDLNPRPRRPAVVSARKEQAP
ncbi:MAG: amidohydrolase family protein [Actinomycetia bacterium]|nr:amidohydrolase family protein [Actinomycetes bacterium]